MSASEIRRSRVDGQRGFSLLEVMIAATLVAMVLGGVMPLLTGGQNTFEANSADMTMRQGARVALDKLTRETRLAGYSIDNVPQAVTVATATILQFASDVDDGHADAPCGTTYENATNGGAERMTYVVAGTQLLRSVDCWNGSSWTNEISGQVVLDNLETGQTVFEYYDEDGTQMTGTLSSANRDAIRSIGINLQLRDFSYTHVTGRATTAFEITSRVEVHNLQ